MNQFQVNLTMNVMFENLHFNNLLNLVDSSFPALLMSLKDIICMHCEGGSCFQLTHNPVDKNTELWLRKLVSQSHESK